MEVGSNDKLQVMTLTKIQLDTILHHTAFKRHLKKETTKGQRFTQTKSQVVISKLGLLEKIGKKSQPNKESWKVLKGENFRKDPKKVGGRVTKLRMFWWMDLPESTLLKKT